MADQRSNLILEKIADKIKSRKQSSQKKPKKAASIFDAHSKDHRKNKVDLTSYQAKKLGLKYMGFSRYGQEDPSTGQCTTTHVVKKGFLQQVTANQSSKDQINDEPEYFDQDVKFSSGKRKHAGAEQHGEALRRYLAGHCDVISKIINSGIEVKHMSKEIQDTVNALDALFADDDSILAKDTIVYTGAQLPQDVKKNATYQYKTYLSASADNKVPSAYIPKAEGKDTLGGGCLLQITARANSRAIAVNSIFKPEVDEKEYIFPRDTILKIIDGPIYSGKGCIWHAEIEPDPEDEALNKKNPPAKKKP